MTTPRVFQSFNSFGYIHHQAMNTPQTFASAVVTATERPEITQILEGDLCWHFDNGRKDLYFRHPKFIVDRLTPYEIAQHLAEGRLMRVEDVLARQQPILKYIFELKIGVGSVEEMLRDLLGLLQNSIPERYWIDGFSLNHLFNIKRLDPRVPTSLHTELVCGNRVLQMSPYRPFFWLPKITSLEFVDAISIRYRFGRRLTRFGCRAVRKAGKELIMSRLFNPQDLLFARREGAIAGYIDFPLSTLEDADLLDNS